MNTDQGSGTIELYFLADPEVVATECTLGFAGTPPVAVVHGAFEMEVVLRVGGLHLFEHNRLGRRVHGHPLPLLDAAIVGLAVVRALPSWTRIRYDFPESGEYLMFEMHGDAAQLTWSYTGASGRTPYAELLAAWERFRDQVRGYLGRECLALRTVPYFRRWLDGEEPGDPPASV